MAEMSVAVPRPAGQAPASALTLENSAWKLYLKKYKQKKSKQSKGWNESMSALWLFPLPFQLPSELSHPWVLEVPAGQEQCPRSWHGAQGPSGISVQALQPELLEMGLGAARIFRKLEQFSVPKPLYKRQW